MLFFQLKDVAKTSFYASLKVNIMYRGGYVYILTNKLKTTLYIGVTSSLEERLWKHKHHYYGPESFSAKYNLDILVYYEGFDTITEAIARKNR